MAGLILRALPALSEDPHVKRSRFGDQLPRPGTDKHLYNSRYRGSDTLFWLPLGPICIETYVASLPHTHI